jgi:hypothetical protein
MCLFIDDIEKMEASQKKKRNTEAWISHQVIKAF